MERIKEILSIELGSEEIKGAAKEEGRLLLVKSGVLQVFCEDHLYLLDQNQAMLIPPYSFLAGFPKTEYCSYMILSFPLEEKSDPAAFSLPAALTDGLFAFQEEPEQLPLLELALLQEKRAKKLDPMITRGNDALFLKAAMRLQEDLQATPSVELLADDLAISLSKLKRLFARYAVCGAHEYLMELRIALAKQTLKEGRSVTETAAICGFANQAYFSAAFKKATGCAPKEYLGSAKREAPAPKKANKKQPKKSAPKRDMPNYLL